MRRSQTSASTGNQYVEVDGIRLETVSEMAISLPPDPQGTGDRGVEAGALQFRPSNSFR